MRGTFRTVAALCLSTSALTGVANAASTDWNDGTASWFTAGNWTNGVPGAGDVATINNGGTAQIGAGTATADTVTIANGSAVTLLSGGVLNATTLNLNGTLSATSTTTTASNIIFNAGTDSRISAAAGTTLSLSGNLTFNTNASDTIYFGSATDTGTVNISSTSVIAGANAGALEIAGGILKDISTTTPQSSFATALGKLKSVTIDSGATLEIDSNGNGRGSSAETYIKLFGSGQLVMGGSNQPRVVLGDSNFAGQISGAGYIGIGEVGTGTMPSTVILTGNNNSAFEFQIARGSVLQIGNGGTSGSLTNSSIVVGYTFFTSSVLKFNRSDNVTLGSGLEGNFILQQAGTGILTVSGNNSAYPPGYFGGSVVVSSGGLSISSNNNLNGSPISLSSGTTLYTTASGTYTSSVTVAGNSAFHVAAGTTTSWAGQIKEGAVDGDVELTGGGTLILANASNAYSGGTVVEGNSTLRIAADGNIGASAGKVTFGDLTSAGTLQLGASFNLAPTRSLTLAIGGGTIDTNGFNTAISQGIAGPGALTKVGTGTLILSGANTYGGGTTISAGTVEIGSGGTTGSINGNVTDNGALVVNRSDSITFSGVISGTGTVTQAGSGTVALTGANTYTGGTIIGAGTLQFGNGGTSGSLAGNVTNNALLIFNRSDAVTFGGVISGTGAVTQQGPGSLILTANNSYTNLTTIAAGTLQLGNSGTTGSVAGNIIDNGALVFNRSDNITYGGAISGTGSLTKSGAGTLTLTGANTYGGGTTISAGTLQIGNGGTTGSITGNVVDNGALVFNRSNAVTFGGVISGSGSVTQEGGNGVIVPVGTLYNGVVTFTGTNTYTGATIIHHGTLAIAGNGSIANSSGVLNTGTFDISAANSDVTVADLTSTGTNSLLVSDGNIVLGRNKLIIANATGSLSGYVSSPFVDTAGITVLAGNLTLNLFNPVPGTLTINNGATVKSVLGNSLYGTKLVNNGTLDISAVTLGGDGVGDLSGSGVVILGSKDFQVYQGLDRQVSTFSGTITGSGQFSVADSTLVLTGANTYTGGTFVTNATFQLGNGGTAGSVVGNIGSNGGLVVFNRSDAVTFSGVISGTGAVMQQGPGTLILTADNSYTGGTTIAAGTLQLGNGGTTGSVAGNITDNAALVFNRSGAVSFGGVISGTGSLTQAGSGTLTLVANNSYTGGTTISSGTLVVGNGATAGSITGNVTDNAALTFNRSNTITFGGVISGTGSLTKTGAGTLILSGANTYGGGTTISSGAVQIGNGGTTGSVAGNIANNAALAFNRSDNATFANVISGTGSLTKLGAGTLTLSGANIFSGATTVAAGSLSVTGSISNSSVSVANGATLAGTGTVGPTAIQSGGTLASGNSIGTLTVNGNLSFAPGAIYSVEVSPSAADRTIASGTASLNGTVATSIASGTYAFGQRFAILTATGGVSGTFASLTGIPSALKGQLGYDATNVYLDLSPNALAPLVTGTTGNQHAIIGAIDAAVAAGTVPSAGFVTLYTLSGPSLNSALDQISGQAAPNVANAVGQGFLSFMSMTAGGGSGDAGSFAPGSAYGKADAPHRAQLGRGETRVWGAAYGGHVGLSGNSASGAASLSSNNVGMIGGADIKLADNLLAGATLGWGRQMFHSGNGSGDSDDFMLGLYGRADAGAGYLAASFGVGWHQITTQRVVTVSGTDVLQGKQDAEDYGGRIEAGWRLAVDSTTSLIPYGAFAGESFDSPAYAETALSGASTFALSYGAHTTALGRSELGARLSRFYGLDQASLTAELHAAWAHQLDDQPFIQASFQNLAGTSFQVAGVRPGRDTALLGLDLEVHNSSGLFFGVKGEGQFGAGTTIVEGLGNFGWRW